MGAPLPETASEQHDWGLQQAQGAGILTRLLWPHLSGPEREEVRSRFRSLLAQSYRLYRPAEGGFAYYSSAPKADLDGTGLAATVLQAAGALPGTWERERVWGKAPAPRLTPLAPGAPVPAGGVEWFRVYRDRMPSDDPYDEAGLVQITYPEGARGLDILELRQGLARFLDADGPAFGNWTSRRDLRAFPFALDRAIRPIPIVRGKLDMARIAREHPQCRRFYVIGYDLVQTPVAGAVVTRPGPAGRR
jgi:hypothetical protein